MKTGLGSYNLDLEFERQQQTKFIIQGRQNNKYHEHTSNIFPILQQQWCCFNQFWRIMCDQVYISKNIIDKTGVKGYHENQILDK